jgi:hypothetical protein
MTLPTIKIQGKDYVQVKDRVLAFNEMYEKGSIVTEITYDGDMVRCKAVVRPDFEQMNRVFVGHSEELRGSTNINKTSATENCETSAVGRALAMMGIGVIESIASADEVIKAKNKEAKTVEGCEACEIAVSKGYKTCFTHK